MGLWKNLNKAMNAVHDVAVGTVGKGAGNILSKGVDKLPGAIEAGAGALDKGIKKGQQIFGKFKDGSIAKGVGKVSKKILTDESSFKQVGIGNKFGLEVSNKFTVLDGVNSAVKSVGDKGAAMFDSVSKDKINVPLGKGKQMNNPFQLIEKSSDSLVGWRATGKGKLLAGAVMLGSGIPGAGKQYVEGRRGNSYDQQVTTSAPRISAYEQNGGATGDLVFALNNLRHGGMM